MEQDVAPWRQRPIYMRMEKQDGIGLLTLNRGKVNAFMGAVVDEIGEKLVDFVTII